VKPSFDATNVMVNYYVLGLMQQRAEMAAGKLGPAYAKWIGAQRDALVAKFAPQVENYLTQAVAGELRWARDDQMPGWLYKAAKGAGGGRAAAQEAILTAAKVQGMGPLEFAQEAARIFRLPGWDKGVFGGKPWANIADAIVHYHDGSLTKTAWLDHVFDLQHNGGSIFSGKVHSVTWDRGFGEYFLDSKLEASDPVELLNKMAWYMTNSRISGVPKMLSPEVLRVLEQGAADGAWTRENLHNAVLFGDTSRTLTGADRWNLPSSKIAWFGDVGKSDAEIVGGKGANLGEMNAAGLPVPPGYVVTAQAFRDFLRDSGIGPKIDKMLVDLDVNKPAQLAKVSKAIQNLIRNAPLTERLREEIVHAYGKLGPGTKVAVRSSGTVEDGAEASFAGMFRSHLDVQGAENVVAKVKDDWASAFGERTLAYAKKQGKHAGDESIAVVVMKMVRSDKSGVMFTMDPTSGKTDRLVIESTQGLGEAVVGGEIVPDRAVISKGPFQVLDEAKSGDGKNALTVDELRQLQTLAQQVEKHYGSPQDIEFAFEGGKAYLVQTRPITKVETAGKVPTVTIRPGAVSLVEGVRASSGTVTGRVRIVRSAADASRFQDGDILVADKTLPDWVPLMMRASAIVTNNGGLISHAAIVARELGVPAIVGTKDATVKLTEGEIVTVDGQSGKIYRGDVTVKPTHSLFLKNRFETYAHFWVKGTSWDAARSWSFGRNEPLSLSNAA
jgi:phosphohistidine swiveling domain-containing protein